MCVALLQYLGHKAPGVSLSQDPNNSIHVHLLLLGSEVESKGYKEILCEQVGPNIVGLLILQEYSSLITCKAIYTKHVS